MKSKKTKNVKSQPSLLEDSITPVLLHFSLPIILSIFASQAYAVADSMIIGLYLDAAIGIVLTGLGLTFLSRCYT